MLPLSCSCGICTVCATFSRTSLKSQHPETMQRSRHLGESKLLAMCQGLFLGSINHPLKEPRGRAALRATTSLELVRGMRHRPMSPAQRTWYALGQRVLPNEGLRADTSLALKPVASSVDQHLNPGVPLSGLLSRSRSLRATLPPTSPPHITPEETNVINSMKQAAVSGEGDTCCSCLYNALDDQQSISVVPKVHY